ncbi:MAG: PH domain-containing protein [Rhodobacteraceae bacterium]|jgi:hypothetical protein|nr:PH domain-containing protein [Paracoccaceae bacterium]
MSHDDFATEPVEGLPERPPEGEAILWQGRPDAWALARDALVIRWVAGYFVLLAVWRFGVSAADMPLGAAALTAVPLVVLGLVACAILYGIAVVQARATRYTITTARVAMRVGAALTITLNLPYRQLETAGLTLSRDGTGTIALRMKPGTKLSYLVLWPHVRPWHTGRVEPALRAIPEAAKVARILAEAAETRVAQPVVEPRPVPMAVAAE